MLHQQTGLRVDGVSVDAVAAGLRTFLTRPEQASEWGQQALQRVQREFAWERVAEKTRQLNLSNPHPD